MDNKFRESRNRMILAEWLIAMNYLSIMMIFQKFLNICKEYPQNTGFYTDRTIDLSYADLTMDGSPYVELQDYYIPDSDICFN
jgi:hypothetical protein